jgi:hypothetical protein
MNEEGDVRESKNGCVREEMRGNEGEKLLRKFGPFFEISGGKVQPEKDSYVETTTEPGIKMIRNPTS